MEEVDNIIITTLREIGCNFDEEITSLSGFSADLVVEACVRCLRLINTDFQSPTVLPEAMSSRYRMCSTLANAIQGLNYPGEIGYQTFLYSSMKEWRKLLMFLLEKLPKDNTQSSDEPTGAGVMLGRAIAAELSLQMRSPWTPPHCKKNSTAWSGTSSWLEGAKGVHVYRGRDVQAPVGTASLTARLSKEVKHYYNRHMPYISAQLKVREDILSSLLEKNASEVAAQQEWELEWNQLGLSSRLTEQEYRSRKRQRLQKKLADQFRTSLQQGQRSVSAGLGLGSDLQTILNSFADKSSDYQGTGSRFQHAEKLQFAQEDAGPQMEEASEEELQRRREEELTALQEQLADLTSKLELLDLNMKKYTASMGQMVELQAQGEAKNKEDEDAYRVKKETFDLLPNAEENIARLQDLIKNSSDRLVKLSAMWEEVRAPLMEHYRSLKADVENKETEATQLLEEIQQMRESMKELANETRLKDELYKQLVSEYERMGKDVSRVSYTRRIIEIMSNIQRQKEDIGKVLIDMRMVQKEINSLTGKLERVFTVTDEQVYKDAKKDETRRAAYKLLASLRENCEKVVEAIKETGQIKREQRDLEEQIDTENSKKVKANLEKITSDYDQMSNENSQLASKLKSQT